MPGSIDSLHHIGTNKLIKQGATLLTSIDDIFNELPRLKGEVSARKFKKTAELTETETKMVDLLTTGPLQVDQLCREMGLQASELLEFLLALELKGVIEEISGKRFVLVQ